MTVWLAGIMGDFIRLIFSVEIYFKYDCGHYKMVCIARNMFRNKMKEN